MAIERTVIPHKARRRTVTPWRLSIGKELTGDELQAIVAQFLAETEYHYVISGDVYPGMTQISGDYWGSAGGRTKELGAVAEQWDQVAELLPELLVDAVIEYRVPAALLDPQPEQHVVDLTE